MASEQPANAGNVDVLHAAVEAFRKREIGYRDILEDLPAAIYTTDTDGRITYFNRACIELCGHAPVLGVDQWCVCWKLSSPEGWPLAREDWPVAAALRAGRALHGTEVIAQRPDGSTVSLLAHPTPIFDAQDECVGAINMLVDIGDQKEAQERFALLAREVDHRSNNLLAVVQSLVRLTKADTISEYQAILEGRLTALARANSLIAATRWANIDLRSLVEEELGAFRTGQVKVSGDPIDLQSGSAQNFGMIVHELTTNAVKHGALSRRTGTVSISWTLEGDELRFTWEENGGPPTEDPMRSNTGNAVIAATARLLQGRIVREWRPEGLRLTLHCRAAAL
ncbi:MAG TPA: HWE histidine kinase domain-containing protein [Sphingomicrobium sp.]